MERPVARTLEVGTAIGTVATAIGCVLAHTTPVGASLEVIGIGAFVGLPVVRVAVMLGLFARRREWRFALLAALVLAILAAGTLVGLRGAHARAQGDPHKVVPSGLRLVR